MNCNDCKNKSYIGNRLNCLLGEKPRFFMPKSEIDCDYGWKVKGCKKFQKEPDQSKDFCLACKCGCVRFHLLQNGNAECAECQSTYIKKSNNWINIG